MVLLRRSRADGYATQSTSHRSTPGTGSAAQRESGKPRRRWAAVADGLESRARRAARRSSQPRPRCHRPCWRVPPGDEEPRGTISFEDGVLVARQFDDPDEVYRYRSLAPRPRGQAKELSARLHTETGRRSWVNAVAVICGHFPQVLVSHENVTYVHGDRLVAPNACAGMNVECINPFQMLSAVGVQFLIAR